MNLNKSEAVKLASAEFKNFVKMQMAVDSEDNISDMARAVGVHSSTLHRYINSKKSHLPAFLIPLLPDGMRTALLSYLDNRSGNPLRGGIAINDCDGSVKDEVEGIMEALGEFIKMDRLQPGNKSKAAKMKMFMRIHELSLQAQQEILNRD